MLPCDSRNDHRDLQQIRLGQRMTWATSFKMGPRGEGCVKPARDAPFKPATHAAFNGSAKVSSMLQVTPPVGKAGHPDVVVPAGNPSCNTWSGLDRLVLERRPSAEELPPACQLGAVLENGRPREGDAALGAVRCCRHGLCTFESPAHWPVPIRAKRKLKRTEDSIKNELVGLFHSGAGYLLRGLLLFYIHG